MNNKMDDFIERTKQLVSQPLGWIADDMEELDCSKAFLASADLGEQKNGEKD